MKRKTNVTLSFPTELISRMQRLVPKGQISKFTVAALNKALDEYQRINEEELEAAYEAASKDMVREAEAEEWAKSNTNEIEGWEWYDEE